MLDKVYQTIRESSGTVVVVAKEKQALGTAKAWKYRASAIWADGFS